MAEEPKDARFFLSLNDHPSNSNKSKKSPIFQKFPRKIIGLSFASIPPPYLPRPSPMFFF
jgi:hypothetical protein